VNFEGIKKQIQYHLLKLFGLSWD